MTPLSWNPEYAADCGSSPQSSFVHLPPWVRESYATKL